MDRVLQIFRYEGNKNCEVRTREMLIDVMGMVTNFYKATHMVIERF